MSNHLSVGDSPTDLVHCPGCGALPGYRCADPDRYRYARPNHGARRILAALLAYEGPLPGGWRKLDHRTWAAELPGASLVVTDHHMAMRFSVHLAAGTYSDERDTVAEAIAACQEWYDLMVRKDRQCPPS